MQSKLYALSHHRGAFALCCYFASHWDIIYISQMLDCVLDKSYKGWIHYKSQNEDHKKSVKKEQNQKKTISATKELVSTAFGEWVISKAANLKANIGHYLLFV